MRRVAALAVLLGLTLTPSPAAAEFHFVSIREVFPGEAVAPNAQYVELQAYAPGQNFIAGHSLTFYDASGAALKTEAFDKEVGDGSNQMTFVMGAPEAGARFGIAADEGMDAGLIDPTGGAVCWEALDCVAWGSFSGSLPSPVGSPATPGGIPDGMALRRTLAPGCPTLLEASDDRDESAVDFASVFPNPRPNSVAPTERPCGDGTGQPRGSERRGAPQTVLRRRPAQRSYDRTPTFRFGADERNVSFECKLDRRRFRRCESPFTARRLSFGRHTFRVRARDASGRADPTPAFDAFRVLRRPG